MFQSFHPEDLFHIYCIITYKRLSKAYASATATRLNGGEAKCNKIKWINGNYENHVHDLFGVSCNLCSRIVITFVQYLHTVIRSKLLLK